MRKSAILLIAGLCAVGLGICLSILINSGPSVYKPGRIEDLLRMPPETGEVSRRNVKVDGVVRETEIVFQDGCVAEKKFDATAADGTSILTTAKETLPDGTYINYTFNTDGKTVTSRQVFRKDHTRYSETVWTVQNKVSRLFFEDGEAVRAVLEGTAVGNVYTFVVYNEHGGKIYEEVEKYEVVQNKEGENEQQPDSGPRKTFLTYTVFNGATNPAYRQSWVINHYEGGEEDDGQNPELEQLEEFHEGTSLVQRTIAFGSSLDLNGQWETVTTVTVLSDKGTARFVRYLDSELRILRTVDKTVNPEQVMDNKALGAPKEEIDLTRLQSPQSETELALKRIALSGPEHTHLNRLLIP